MKPGDKVFVVDGTRLRMTRFLAPYSGGRALVGYHFDTDTPGWVVDAGSVFTSEDAARERLAVVLAEQIAKHERAIARLRAIDAVSAPVLVRSLRKRKPKTLTAIAGGAR